MKLLRLNWRRLALLAFAATPLLLNGCATPSDTENASVRPWNSPKSWENGLPSMMTEGR